MTHADFVIQEMGDSPALVPDVGWRNVLYAKASHYFKVAGKSRCGLMFEERRIRGAENKLRNKCYRCTIIVHREKTAHA